MMKNLTKFMAFAATAMMLFSCGSDDNITPNESGAADGSSVKATMGQLAADGDVFPSSEPSTRTTLGDQNEIKWVKGDSISISYGTDNRRFNVSAISEDGTSCTFAGTPLGDNQNATRYVAVYPYSMKATFSGTTVSGVTLPYVQNAVAGGFDPACNLMTASAAVGSNLAFKHVCSYFKVKPAFDCAGITITATNGEKLAGTFDVTVAEDGTPSVSDITSESNQVKLVGDIKAGETYYIAVLPGTYSSGIKVLLEKNARKLSGRDKAFDWTNSTLTLSSYSRSASTSISTSSAKIKSLGSLTETNTTVSTKTIEFVDLGYGDDIKAEHGKKVLWAKCNLGANSETENGDYYAWGEVKSKDTFTLDNYLCKDYYPSTLDEAHDAAAANLGYGWHMATPDELVEMKENTIWIYSGAPNGIYMYPQGNVNGNPIKNYQKMSSGIKRYPSGYNVTAEPVSDEDVIKYINDIGDSKPSVHLYFPFAGSKPQGGGTARYWLNGHGEKSIVSGNNTREQAAFYLGIWGDGINTLSRAYPRYVGMPVRPVLEVEW